MILSRREVLKGMGATVALPFLDAMNPAVRLRASGASARQTRQPLRLVCIEQVHGAAAMGRVGLANRAEAELGRSVVTLQDNRLCLHLSRGWDTGGHPRAGGRRARSSGP